MLPVLAVKRQDTSGYFRPHDDISEKDDFCAGVDAILYISLVRACAEANYIDVST